MRAAATCNGNCVRVTLWLRLTVNGLQIANKGVHVLGVFKLFHFLCKFLPTALSMNSIHMHFGK